MTSYTTLEVENFKGIREMKLEGLGMVNVFVGGNNVGKTSVLQALTIGHHGRFNFEYIETMVKGLNIPNMDNGEGLTNEKFIFYSNAILDGLITYGFLSKNEIPNKNPQDPKEDWFKELKEYKELFSYKSQKNAYKMELTSTGDNSTYSYFRNLPSPLFSSGDYCKELPLNINFSWAVWREPKLLLMYRDNMSYINSTFFKDANYIKLFEQVQTNKKSRKELILALQKIEPKLIDIRRSEEKLLLDLIDFEDSLPMSIEGEGFSKLLILFCKMKEFKSKALFIDEIENGFHYSVQEDMWRMILTAAKEDGTQFFFTTHSYEVLESLNAMTQKIIAEWEQEKAETKNYQDDKLLVGENKTPMEPVCVFSLAKSTDDVVTYKRFDKDSLEGAIALQMELRGKGAN